MVVKKYDGTKYEFWYTDGSNPPARKNKGDKIVYRQFPMKNIVKINPLDIPTLNTPTLNPSTRGTPSPQSYPAPNEP